MFLNGTALFFIVRILFDDVVENSTQYQIAGNNVYVGEAIVSAIVLAGVGLLFIKARDILQKIQTVLAAVLLVGIILTALFAVSVASVPDGFSSWQEYISGLDGLSGITAVPTFYTAKAIPGVPGIVIMTITAISAILMDIQMPVMDGYEATKAIRELKDKDISETPIIAMTANAFKEDVDAALKAGMQAHIAKPIDIAVLMKTLTDVLIAAEDNKDNEEDK